MYSFPSQLKIVKKFYGQTMGGYSFGHSVVGMLGFEPQDESIFVAKIEQNKFANESLLKRLIPIMLCTVWEEFSTEVFNNEPGRYKMHFSKYGKWQNELIKEISLIRNCIVHNNSVIDDPYINNPVPKRFPFKIGDKIDFSEAQVEEIFKLFEDSHNIVIK